MHLAINNMLLKVGVYFVCPYQILVRFADQYFSICPTKSRKLDSLVIYPPFWKTIKTCWSSWLGSAQELRWPQPPCASVVLYYRTNTLCLGVLVDLRLENRTATNNCFHIYSYAVESLSLTLSSLVEGNHLIYKWRRNKNSLSVCVF